MIKWISIMMMIAMVVTTIIPTSSHASMKHSENATSQTAAAHAGHDCDHNTKKDSHDKNSQNNKPCCDKNMCKCVGGNCHGGLTMIFGSSDLTLLSPNPSKLEFFVTQESSASGLTELIQRPPRA